MTKSVPGRSSTMSELSDAEVLARSRSDPAAFRAIFERHHAALHAYLRRRVRADEAADIAAETFVTAFRRRASYDVAQGSARGWLFGIASNLLRHHWRRERRELHAYARTGVDPLVSEEEDVEARVDAELAGPVLARVLASLPRADREVLLLHAWADLSDAEIAEALGVPVGTVYSRLSRARGRMREGIAASGKH